MTDRETAMRAVTDAVTLYLSAHPGAADTAQGIQRWWLPPEYAAEAPALVEAALESLAERGIASRTRLPDGRVLYAAGTTGTARGAAR